MDIYFLGGLLHVVWLSPDDGLVGQNMWQTAVKTDVFKKKTVVSLNYTLVIM